MCLHFWNFLALIQPFLSYRKNVGSIVRLLNSSSLSYISYSCPQEFIESTTSQFSFMEQVHTNTGTHVRTCIFEPKSLQRQCKYFFILFLAEVIKNVYYCEGLSASNNSIIPSHIWSLYTKLVFSKCNPSQ